MTEDKEMSKAMRQMLEQSGRAGVARGEAACDPASDEACGPLLEHQGTGSAKQTAGTGGLLQAALGGQKSLEYALPDRILLGTLPKALQLLPQGAALAIGAGSQTLVFQKREENLDTLLNLIGSNRTLTK